MFGFKFSGLIFLVSMLTAQASFALYSPQQALKDALSEPLEYMGQFIPKSSESGRYPECVFKNSKTVVISSYCVKRSVPAGRLLFIPANSSEGYVRLYAEIASNKDISQAAFKEYVPQLFYSAVITPQKMADIQMTFEQIKNWNEEDSDDFSRYCVSSYSQKDLPNSTHCKNLQDESQVWAKASARFLNKAEPNFVRLLVQLKSQVP